MIDYSIIDSWYSGYLPTFKNLLEFSIKSNELTKEVINTPIVFDKKAETAYMMNGKCILPGLFFLEDFYEKHLGIDEQDRINAAISIVNGSQIHESLHHKILGADSDWHTVLHELNRFYLIENNPCHTQVFKDCFNIIEDIFTNYLCSVEYSHIFVFVDLLDKTMFNDHIYDMCYEKLYLDDKKQVFNVLNMLACYKNFDNYSKETQVNSDYREHLEILKKARNEKLTLQERFDLSEELYNLLKQNHENDDKFKKQISSRILDQRLGEFSDTTSENYEKLNELQETFNIISQTDQLEEIPVVFVEVSGNSKIVKYDNKFRGFSQYIHNARAERQTFIEPRYTGSRLLSNRLFMAESEGKIFGRRDNTILEKGNPEIIFLLDWSGSMESSGLTIKVLNAGLTVFKDLKENGISCSFYAHTTTIKDECLIVAIASNDMPLMSINEKTSNHDFEKRFGQLYNTECLENADGFALDFVSKRFSSKQGKKVVIVLSDGQPSVVGLYGSSKAKNHIQNICKNLRESNISVVSLSLTESVMQKNNEIYGIKHNIAAYGENLQSNLKNLIEEIVI